MSLCYDFQKWSSVSMASVAVSLTVGLVSLVYGQMSELDYETDYSEHGVTPEQRKAVDIFGKLDSLVKYCYEHASDSSNPVQDLIDKGFLDPQFLTQFRLYSGQTCASVTQIYSDIMNNLAN